MCKEKKCKKCGLGQCGRKYITVTVRGKYRHSTEPRTIHCIRAE